ncbi:right-handed parallel beta-helix repeat-containing protein [Streptomyces sp. NPDC056749]|uniref:right-handed parallel beta-helix repeat-containing protein n=1 Tax=Streptomyces sp. NPDC056749 TaxID=3345936 RepID=UPI0036C42B94
MLFTYGGSPSAVLTDAAGNVMPNYPIQIRRAGTGELVTALFEADGTTPIGQLRTNPVGSSQPGAVRAFTIADVQAIDYEYLAVGGAPVRWYEPGREVATSALQAAQAAQAGLASKLDQTGGTVSGPVTFSGGASFTGPVTGIPTLAGLRWHNVADYGAVGDGIADDLPAIQAALDAAYNQGGGVVIFPPGRTYSVASFMVCRARTTVIAYGARIKSINATRGVFRNFYPEDTFAGYAGHSDITVLGGTWDGNAYKASDGTGITTGTTNVMTFIHCSNVIVRDAVFRDTCGAHALEVNAVSGVRVSDCRFEGFVDNTVDQSRVTSEFVEIDIARNGNSAIGLFDGTACRDVTFERCYFGPSPRLPAAGRAIGSHGISAGSYYDRITVRDCEIIGTTADCGIRALYWRDSLISGNTITNTATEGIYAMTDATTAHACQGLIIESNQIRTSGANAGIRVTALATALWSDVVIRGNIVRSATAYGIRADYTPGVLIEGNRIISPTTGGILAQDSNRATVSNNQVQSSGSNAINIAGCASGIVTGNLVDGTTTNHGIVVGGSTVNGSNVVITGNHIRAAAAAGIRLGTPGCLVTGNQVKKDGGSTVNGISMVATATGCVIAGNDLTGNSWTAAVALVVAGAPVLDWAGGTTSPGHNRI